MTVHADLPPEVAAFLGREVTLPWGADAASRELSRRWCEVFEDGNPLYADGPDAQVAPPTMTHTLAQPAEWPPQPGADASALDGAPPAISERAVQSCVWEFIQPVRHSDRLRMTECISAISPARMTRLGTGHFITVARAYHNQRGELVGKMEWTTFRYRRGSAIKRDVVAGRNA